MDRICPTSICIILPYYHANPLVEKYFAVFITIPCLILPVDSAANIEMIFCFDPYSGRAGSVYYIISTGRYMKNVLIFVIEVESCYKYFEADEVVKVQLRDGSDQCVVNKSRFI